MEKKSLLYKSKFSSIREKKGQPRCDECEGKGNELREEKIDIRCWQTTGSFFRFWPIIIIIQHPEKTRPQKRTKNVFKRYSGLSGK